MEAPATRVCLVINRGLLQETRQRPVPVGRAPKNFPSAMMDTAVAPTPQVYDSVN